MEYIFKDAGAGWAISDGKCSERVRQAGVQVHILGGADDPVPPGEAAYEPSDRSGNREALVLYQSDPSGRANGVVVKHSALLPRPFAGTATILETDRIGRRVRLSTEENAILELLRLLTLGATLVDLGTETTPRKLATMLRDQAVTVLLPRAVELERLATGFNWALRTIRIIILCDDHGAALERLQKSLKPEVLSRTYRACGSNETYGWWALYPMDDNDKGITDHLAAGVRLQLLDNDGAAVPENIVAEIHIGGPFLARHDDQGAPRNPAFLYRSGEFGWRRADGSLKLSGRRDGRGWISGVRVEAEEIEFTLSYYSGLQDAAVLVGDDAVRAFIVVGEGEKIAPEAVQTWLSQKLPAVMVPQKFDRTEKVPRLPDGTIDRKALKAMAHQFDNSAAIAPYVAPRNETERKLVTIWQQTLGLDRVGIHDDFFRIGGHSLMATLVVGEIRDELGVTVPLRQLFEAATIAQLAEIVASSSGSAEVITPIRRVARTAGAQAVGTK
jgi:acyl-CoA synthetase (AMP-forming)/AMP-acid ligase II/acyl carrier protein